LNHVQTWLQAREVVLGQAAQIIAGKGVKVLITGNVGPNAFQALLAAGIRIVIDTSGTVKEVLEKYKRGELSDTGAPTVARACCNMPQTNQTLGITKQNSGARGI